MKMKTEKDFSEYLKNQLKDLGLTQIELAKKMHNIMPNGYTLNALKTSINKWLAGNRYPGTEYLYYLAQVLNVSIVDLLTQGEFDQNDKRPYTLYTAAKIKTNVSFDELLNQKDKYGDSIIVNTDEFGYNLLDYAIEFENIQLIDTLLKKGYLSFYGFSPNTVFCANYYQDNENFQKLVKLAVKLDNLEIFSSAINRTFPIVEKNPQKTIEFETYALDKETIKDILSTEKIFNYLTMPDISAQDFNQINRGIYYKDSNGQIINDKLAALPRLSASFNILLNTAIKYNSLDKAKQLIDIAIKHKNEVVPKIIEIKKDRYFSIEQGVISFGRFSSINIIGYITPENLKALSNTSLKPKADLLMKEN